MNVKRKKHADVVNGWFEYSQEETLESSLPCGQAYMKFMRAMSQHGVCWIYVHVWIILIELQCGISFIIVASNH